MINYYIEGAKNLLKAKFLEAIHGQVAKEIQEFRKHQCSSCPLYNRGNNRCNRDYFSDGKSLVHISRMDEFEKIEVNGEVTQIKVNDVIFTRGCGCKLWDKKAEKIRYHFTEEELNKKDGTAPCPLNRWTLDEYVKYNKDIESKSGDNRASEQSN